ncbi:MAG: SRPBCC family protein [Ketobacteraceae bacterium]|nr:SRPBCC family protein [Ketobacteraceae bacterium]
MALTRIHMQQSFNAPVDTIFDILSDHVQFGDILSADIKRVVDSQTDYVNGLGSVRRITLIPTQSFEETITGFEPNALIEYRITRGSPLKNHKGIMRFTEENGKTHLDYQIQFEPRLPIPFFAKGLELALERTISGGLKKLANSLN